MKSNASQADRGFFWAATAALLLLSAAPFIFGWALTPPGYQFYGNSLLSPADPSVYYSYIEQGRTGHLFMVDAFTSEPARAVLWQPLWWLVGQLANVLHLSTPVAFLAARWAVLPVLMAALWSAIRWLWADRLHRQVGLVLTAFGAGVGGLIAIIWPNWIDFASRTGPDLWVSEMYVVLSALTNAHFLLVTAGLLFTLVAVERTTEDETWRRVLPAGLVLLLALSVHPFHAVTLLLTWLFLTLVRWLDTGTFPGAYIRRWAVVFLISTPALLYYALQLLFDPLVVGRAAQNLNLMTSPIRTVVGLGAFLPLAALSFARHWRHQRYRWLAGWAVAILIAVYLPLDFQRRLGQGVIIPLALLATPLLVGWWLKLRNRRNPIKVAAVVVAAVIFFFSPLFVIGANMNSYIEERQVGEAYVYFLSPEYQALLAKVRALAPSTGGIMAAVTNGRILAGLTARRVFIGSSVETLAFDRKLAELKNFYGTMSLPEQRQLLGREHLCFILDGPREEAYGQAFRPDRWSDLRLIWAGQTMRLYAWTDCRGG